LHWELKLNVCRGYGFSIDQVEEMDFMAYLLAMKDMAECPIVDKSLLMMFGGKSKQTMSVSERRNATRRSAR